MDARHRITPAVSIDGGTTAANLPAHNLLSPTKSPPADPFRLGAIPFIHTGFVDKRLVIHNLIHAPDPTDPRAILGSPQKQRPHRETRALIHMMIHHRAGGCPAKGVNHWQKDKQMSGGNPMNQATIHDLHRAYRIIDRLSGTSRAVLMKMWGYEQGMWGQCRAKNKTLADQVGRRPRTVQTALKALRESGLWDQVDKRMRFSARRLTDLGRLVCRILRGDQIEAVPMDEQISISGDTGAASGAPDGAAHKRRGGAEHTPKKKEGDDLGDGSADPKRGAIDRVDPHTYQRPRRAGSLTAGTWAVLADWMGTADTRTYARCRIAHRGFSGIVQALGKSREWGRYERAVRGDGLISVHPEQVVRGAIISARRSGARFGTVESAMSYITAIITCCVRDRRVPC